MSATPATDITPVAVNPTRAIVHRTRGSTHGPITRLMSPGDLGQVLKPFVFLDLVNFHAQTGTTRFGMHPHSGIATLDAMTQGDARADSTGQAGVLPAGGVEWTGQAGGRGTPANRWATCAGPGLPAVGGAARGAGARTGVQPVPGAV